MLPNYVLMPRPWDLDKVRGVGYPPNAVDIRVADLGKHRAIEERLEGQDITVGLNKSVKLSNFFVRVPSGVQTSGSWIMPVRLRFPCAPVNSDPGYKLVGDADRLGDDRTGLLVVRFRSLLAEHAFGATGVC